MALDDVLRTIVTEEVRKRASLPYITAVYLMGSSVLDDSLIPTGVSDIDLVGIIDTERLKDAQLHKSRYGSKLILPNFEEVRSVGLKPSEYIIDWTLLPKAGFSNTEHLLSTHDHFAASSALMHADVFLDTHNWLSNIVNEIRQHFACPKYLCRRIIYTYEQCLQKLDEYEEDIREGCISLKAVWDGIGYGLMGIGTMYLTAYRVPPTFRYHLLRVRECLCKQSMPRRYSQLLSFWGLADISMDYAECCISEAKILYVDTAEYAPRQSILVNRLKVAYYLDALQSQLSSGLWQEGLSTALFLACHTCDRQKPKERERMSLFWWEVLAQLGWTAPDAVNYVRHCLHLVLAELLAKLDCGIYGVPLPFSNKRSIYGTVIER